MDRASVGLDERTGECLCSSSLYCVPCADHRWNGVWRVVRSYTAQPWMNDSPA